MLTQIVALTHASRIRGKDKPPFPVSGTSPYLGKSEPPEALPDRLIQLPTYSEVSLGPNKSENCQVKHPLRSLLRNINSYYSGKITREILSVLLWLMLQLHNEQQQECQQQKYNMASSKTLAVPRLSRDAPYISTTSST